jgi:hypothetical protein
LRTLWIDPCRLEHDRSTPGIARVYMMVRPCETLSNGALTCRKTRELGRVNPIILSSHAVFG